MIKTVKRRRKQRYHRLREMIQNNDNSRHHGGRGEEGVSEIVCPVCLETVFGDPDVTEAHVDACLIHAIPGARGETEIDIEESSRTRATEGVNLTGLAPPASMIDPALNLVHLTLQLQASTLEMQTAKMSKTKSMSTEMTRRFSVRHSSLRWISYLHRDP